MEPKVLGIALDTLVHSLLAGVTQAVILKVAAGGESLSADHAEVRLHARVPHHVDRQVGLLHIRLGAERAGVRLLVSMQHAVLLQRVFGRKPPWTLVTLVLEPADIWRQVLVLDVRVEVGVLYKKVVQIKACLNTVTVGTVLQRQSI